AAFEAAGFADVKTVLVSGNVVFDARSTSVAALEQKAEAAMHEHLGQAFMTFIRPLEQLRDLLATDPYKAFTPGPKAKRIVTFLRERPKESITLPVELHGADPRDERWGDLQLLSAHAQGTGVHVSAAKDLR